MAVWMVSVCPHLDAELFECWVLDRSLPHQYTGVGLLGSAISLPWITVLYSNMRQMCLQAALIYSHKRVGLLGGAINLPWINLPWIMQHFWDEIEYHLGMQGSSTIRVALCPDTCSYCRGCWNIVYATREM